MMISIVLTEAKFTDVVLELTNKVYHDKLWNYQKYPTFTLHDSKNNKYTYKFNLKLEDTALGESLMYQRNFDKVPFCKPFLFVCTVHMCRHNILQKNLYMANLSSMRFHFLEAENDIDIIAKHKGIINRLDHKEALLFAGEIYKTKDELIYNLMTGSLRDNMFKNNDNIVIHNNMKRSKNTIAIYFIK